MDFYLMNKTDWPVSEEFLNWFFAEITRELSPLALHQDHLNKQVGVIVVNEAEMTELNGQYRQKKGPTDVLSFEGGEQLLGDVVICRELVASQAVDHGLDESEEFTYLLLHGFLHLLGYEHEDSESKAKKMFGLQDKIFEVLMDQDILVQWKRKKA